MSAELWIALDASSIEKEMNNKIKSLEMLLNGEAHCLKCKFFKSQYCNGLINKNTLKIAAETESVFCTSFILEDRKYLSNELRILPVDELEF